MSYSSMAVRFFTSPKPLGDSLADSSSGPRPSSSSPPSPSPSPRSKETDGNAVSFKMTTAPSAHVATNLETGLSASYPPAAEPQGITFANQNSLPKLPIPDLEASCRRHLECLSPLQTVREHEDTKAAVHDFLKSDGPELQEKLKNYASSKTSFIEQFWYDSYLNFDNPVVLNLNPFFLLEDDPSPARNDQVTRAASLVVSTLSFVRAVRREELPPDTARGKPLCMFQYSRLFGTARVPTENGCVIGQDSSSKHVVVLCRGQFYWFDVLDKNNDPIMSEKDIAINLQVIIEDAAQTPIQDAAKGALGVLSTENRKIWSGLRDIMTRDPASNNAECLNIVDTALFVLCLDYTEPSSVSKLCENMLCGTSEVVKGVQIGTCTNRWYDKLQIIVCKNGSAGINFEHTGVDGHTVLRFASDLYTDTILRFARTINGQAPSLWTSSTPAPAKRNLSRTVDNSTTPHKLEWDMGPEMTTAVRFAESHLADLLHQHEMCALDFTGYGKNFITSMGLSPDAFVQMAFQAAYYGLYGRIENTYEPAMTKIFLHGRTEAVRTVTHECLNFVRTLWGDNPAADKVEALRKAVQKHTENTKICSQGQGCDRHLYALYSLWQRSFDDSSSGRSSPTGYLSTGDNGSQPGSPLSEDGGSPRSAGSSRRTSPAPVPPALFNDPGWDKINSTVLSSSNCGNPSLRHFGFGPTSADGFGIGYIIKDDSIAICASSKHRQTERFMQTLEGYLNEIRKLLRATQRADQQGPLAAKPRADTDSSTTEATPERPGAGERAKSTGRIIRPEPHFSRGAETPTTVSEELDDDGMGGYGFFDAGMLLHALKELSGGREGREKPAKKRLVGKMLKLNEY